ncbi:MAG: hypothetical protein ACLROI_00660 [Beduini sp.]|uniref:hypothetical protein n=1 Tax=Beduini sp. TaxID=1922300 RepID=UPI0011C8AD08
MKKKYFSVIIFAIIVIIIGCYTIIKLETNKQIKYNKELFETSLSPLNETAFEFDKTFILLMNTTNTNMFENISYLAKMNDNNSKIDEVYILDYPCQAISYNQQEKTLILYGHDKTIYVNEKNIEIISSNNTEILRDLKTTLNYNQIKDMQISSFVTASYPTVGYTQVVNMLGITNILPIGVARTDTVIRYP